MRLLRFSAIYVILLMTVVGLASCDTTRRASRRIRNIVNEHPELLSYDTVKIDTMVPVIVAADSTIVTAQELDTATVIVHHTEHGTFVIERLESRDVKITYTPTDTIPVRIRQKVLVPHLTIEEKTTLTLADYLRWGVVFIIAFLFLRLFVLAKK